MPVAWQPDTCKGLGNDVFPMCLLLSGMSALSLRNDNVQYAVNSELWRKTQDFQWWIDVTCTSDVTSDIVCNAYWPTVNAVAAHSNE